MTWDNYAESYYKLYYEDEADDEYEDYDGEKSENDDHGPIQFSASTHNESSNHEEKSRTNTSQLVYVFVMSLAALYWYSHLC